mmetsp:Transcript_35828/g.62936  ORF Transcript_35828/g.62936 Transcript_35828/m.62936 type:complete len:156 (+) Transcript_35828:809-1276(+)
MREDHLHLTGIDDRATEIQSDPLAKVAEEISHARCLIPPQLVVILLQENLRRPSSKRQISPCERRTPNGDGTKRCIGTAPAGVSDVVSAAIVSSHCPGVPANETVWGVRGVPVCEMRERASLVSNAWVCDRLRDTGTKCLQADAQIESARLFEDG